MSGPSDRKDVQSARPAAHALDAPPFGLLDSPLEYFLADHLRQRALCALLKQFIQDKKASREDADRTIVFLTRDLAMHHADEEEDLFPALRRRARTEDNLGVLLAQLREDDRRGHAMIDLIVASLSKFQPGDVVRLERPTLEVMQAYVAGEHNHIAIENAVVLAIAGVRLSRADLKRLSHSMKVRRGVADR